MSGDRSKLPRWAQLELERLEANLRSVAAERDAILQGAGAGAGAAIVAGLAAAAMEEASLKPAAAGLEQP